MSLDKILDSLMEKMNFRKKVSIGGIEFELSPLTYEQDQMINSFPDEQEDPLAFYEKTRAQILAFSICKINGEEIPDIVEVKKEGVTESTKEKAIYLKDIIKKLPPKVIEKLFEVYIDFKEEVDNKLDSEVEYTWFKTPEQRKEERENKEDKSEKDKSQEEAVTEAGVSKEQDPIIFTPIVEKEEENTVQE